MKKTVNIKVARILITAAMLLVSLKAGFNVSASDDWPADKEPVVPLEQMVATK